MFVAASFRQLRQSSEKSVEAMSSTEAIVSCNSNGTYNEKEVRSTSFVVLSQRALLYKVRIAQ